MGITTLHHVSITAPQEVIDRVVTFYTDILDLTDGDRPDFGIPGHWLYKDDHPLVHLIVSENNAGANGYFDHVAFRCDNLEGVKQKLSHQDIHFDTLEMDALKQTQLFVTDPAGIRVELNF